MSRKDFPLTLGTSRPTASTPMSAQESAPGPAGPWTAINTIRGLAMDAVQAANSGHPGTPMALAPVAYVLWQKLLRHSPAHPEWADRDRFVLSCGHASMLIYSLLHLSGYDLSLEEIRQFRQWGSRTPGHPERGHTPGVEVTTGPLGQGVANAVGMAMAEAILADRFNRPEYPVVDHRTWALVSDGDLMEGVAAEAASLAGHLKLAKLNLIYDQNHITIDGETELAFTEDVAGRFAAYGWHVERVADGNDLAAIEQALAAAARAEQPSLIILRSHIADPAPNKRDTPAAHGAPLGEDEVRATKKIMGWPPDEQFYVPEAAREDMGRAVALGEELEAKWRSLLAEYREAHPELAAEFSRWLAGELPDDWGSELPRFDTSDGPLATRQASSKALAALSDKLGNMVGGSADLAGSTGVLRAAVADFSAGRPGLQVHWGIREHAMAACCNGIAAHGGLRPFNSTFLVFSDYMKPSIRLAALMRLPVTFIGTHDSIGVGEDGPTHQPIEHLAMLRAIPGLTVIRPADATETVEAWRWAIQQTDGPVMLALTRQKVPVLDRSRLASAAGVARGGYILYEPSERPRALVMATGSEVHIALAAARGLSDEGLATRVVSLPSWEIFDGQPQAYRDEVLPPGITARVSLEAAATFGWERYLGPAGVAVGIDRFGASAPGEKIYQELGLTPERIMAEVRQVYDRSMV